MRYYTELFSFIPQSAATLLTLAVALLFAVLFFLFRYPHARINYLFLFTVTALFGTGFALLDWYLHPWDEQFHALVARNLARNPLDPALLDGCAKLDYRQWTNNRTWLHKQPLFLWQMALSVKLFGANILAVRLPSVLLHAASTMLVLSIAKRYLSYFFAVLAAVLFGFSGLLNDYVSGAMGMDHNDVAFIFYVTASFWAWLKYRENPSWKWALLIGLFSGGAVLCKWLVGLVAYAGWGTVVLVWERRQRWSWKHLFGAFVVTVLVAAPWQLYCMAVFPNEFFREMQYNSLHLFKSLERHTGDVFYYWKSMKAVYGSGELLRVIVLLGLAMMWFAAIRKHSPERFFAAFTFTLIYTFFTAAATKLPGYVLIVSSFGFVFLLLPIDRLAEYIRSGKSWLLPWWSLPFGVMIVFLLHFSPKGVIDRHYYRAPEVSEAWQNDLLYAAKRIRNDTASRCFLIANAPVAIVPALRFMTGREIYPSGTKTCETCAEIDLQERRPAMRPAN